MNTLAVLTSIVAWWGLAATILCWPSRAERAARRAELERLRTDVAFLEIVNAEQERDLDGLQQQFPEFRWRL